MNTRFDLAWSPEGFFGFPRQANRLFASPLFEGLFGDEGRNPEFNSAELNSYVPEIEVEENESQYLVNLEVPGLSKNEIKIELKDGNLVISGEKRTEKKEKTKTYHVSERRYGRFQRVLHLPNQVDAEKVEAVAEDGVLKITLPKSEAAKTKVIEIKSEAKTLN